MGPELGAKSAGGCSYHQRSGRYTATIRKQRFTPIFRIYRPETARTVRVLWLHVYGYKSDRYHRYNGFIYVSRTDIRYKYHIYRPSIFLRCDPQNPRTVCCHRHHVTSFSGAFLDPLRGQSPTLAATGRLQLF